MYFMLSLESVMNTKTLVMAAAIIAATASLALAPTFRAKHGTQAISKRWNEEVAQTEQKLIDAITNYQKQDCSGS